MDSKHEALLRDLVRDVPVVVSSSRGPGPIDPSYTVIGTSGSTDYLNDSTGNQRFWPVSVQAAAPDDGQICDGLHDEGTPTQYLCSRCFPEIAGEISDLTEPQEDEHEEAQQDEAEEME